VTFCRIINYFYVLQVSWYFYDSNNKRQKLDQRMSDRHVVTQDHGLVIIGAHEKDAGR